MLKRLVVSVLFVVTLLVSSSVWAPAGVVFVGKYGISSCDGFTGVLFARAVQCGVVIAEAKEEVDRGDWVCGDYSSVVDAYPFFVVCTAPDPLDGRFR